MTSFSRRDAAIQALLACAGGRDRISQYLSDRIEFDTNGGCHLWALGVDTQGYGQANIGAVNISAHRLTWLLLMGEIPARNYVCHHCDIPVCCRPDHLFVGPPLANVEDMIRKGRKARLSGSACSWSSIDEEGARIAANMLRLGASHAEVAAAVSCGLATISHLAAGETWVEITGGPIHCFRNGERAWNAKLTEDDVREIRRLDALGVHYRRIADMVGSVSPGTIQGVIHRRRWAHVE